MTAGAVGVGWLLGRRQNTFIKLCITGGGGRRAAKNMFCLSSPTYTTRSHPLRNKRARTPRLETKINPTTLHIMPPQQSSSSYSITHKIATMTIKKDGIKSKPVKRKKSGSRKRTAGEAAPPKGTASPAENRPPGMSKNKWKKQQRRLSDNAPDATATSVEPDVENVPDEGTASPSEPKPPGMGKNKWKKLQRSLNVNAPDVISTSSESITKETKVDVESASAEKEKLDDTNSEVTKETTKETSPKVSKKVKRDKKDDTNSEVTKQSLGKKVKQSKKDVGSASAKQDKLDDAKSEVPKETSSKVSATVNHEEDVVVTRRQSSRKKH